ncbi:MAG: GldG family protein [Calditrichota bacterium]
MNLKRADIFSPLGIVLVVVNLIVFNLWMSKVFGRLDLTETRIYTLSDITKKVLRDLDEPLTVKAFFTKDLPAPYNNISRYVEDQLAEMKAYGGNNFRYEFLDPGGDEALKKEAEKYRLEPMQVNEMRADKMEFKLVYLGMALIFEDKQEVIPAIQPDALGSLEYEVVSKIKRITSSETQSIGFVEGHEEPILREQLKGLDRELRKMYDLKPVNFTSRATVPEGIDVLCLIGPKADLPERDKFAIDQFLMRGGRMFLALNAVETDISQMSAQKSKLRLGPWLANYGIKINEDLVMDRRAPTLPFQTMTRYGQQITMVVYPLFPEVITFAKDIIAMQSLRQVRLYFPTTVDTTLAAGMDSVKVSVLLYSSDKSTIQSAPYDINPLQQRGRYTWDQARLPLGMVVQGKFDSYWKDKEIPVDTEGVKVSDEEIIPHSLDTRIVVIPDANFIQDQFLVPGLDNLTMTLNLVDWLMQDEDLIKIRSREVGSRPIGEVSDAVRRMIKYINLIIPPLIVIIFGLIRWQIRRARKVRTDILKG